jgi:hypothetical protein
MSAASLGQLERTFGLRSVADLLRAYIHQSFRNAERHSVSSSGLRMAIRALRGVTHEGDVWGRPRQLSTLKSQDSRQSCLRSSPLVMNTAVSDPADGAGEQWYYSGSPRCRGASGTSYAAP